MKHNNINALTPQEHDVIVNKGTERPHSYSYNMLNDDGLYLCKLCHQPLLSSDHKFDAGCGWPSFFDQYDNGAINITQDTSHGMVHEEITCSNCDSHLGHIFPDGPLPTGVRYCVNGTSLLFSDETDHKDDNV